ERPDKGLGDVLAERGWIQPADRPHVEYLVERYLREHAGDAKAATAHLLVSARRSLAGLAILTPESTVYYSLPAPDTPRPGGPKGQAATETRYDFTSIHAAGGMGRVWRARDRQLDREVALKELRPEQVGNSKIAARF